MKTFKVTTIVQVESWVDAEDEAEAVREARFNLHAGASDRQVIIEEYAEELYTSEDADE